MRGRPPKATSLTEYFRTGKAKQLWKEAKEEASKFGQRADYDDGKYDTQLVDSYSSTSQNGRFQNVFTFQFLNGDYKGKKVYKYQGVENSTGVAILIKDLAILGYEISDPEEIEDVNKKLKKDRPKVQIRIKTSGEYKNINLIQILENDEENDEEEIENEEESENEEVEEESEDEDDEEEDDKPHKKTSKDTDEDEESDDEDSADDSEEEEEEDEDEEEEESEEVSLDIGTKVKVQHNKEVVKGTIVKLFEDSEEIKVKLPNGNKIRVPAKAVVDVL